MNKQLGRIAEKNLLVFMSYLSLYLLLSGFLVDDKKKHRQGHYINPLMVIKLKFRERGLSRLEFFIIQRYH